MQHEESCADGEVTEWMELWQVEVVPCRLPIGPNLLVYTFPHLDYLLLLHLSSILLSLFTGITILSTGSVYRVSPFKGTYPMSAAV